RYPWISVSRQRNGQAVSLELMCGERLEDVLVIDLAVRPGGEHGVAIDADLNCQFCSLIAREKKRMPFAADLISGAAG
ncbi:hypothetical protein IVB38_21600, partial [Bradyrhizobium sp. 38]|uniref:hypothetical protein n=1 Tax=Bradyrhizobium sp. 38 TaxID=2782672 RepID=UPI001FFA93BA